MSSLGYSEYKLRIEHANHNNLQVYVLNWKPISYLMN
jgi:hypothetical protein